MRFVDKLTFESLSCHRTEIMVNYFVPLIEYFVPQLLFVSIFMLTGLHKLFGNQAELSAMFTQLPAKWFWNACGAWEISISVLYLLGAKQLAVVMSYTLLGGACFASCGLKTREDKSLLETTSGLVLIPVSLYHFFNIFACY